LETRALDEASPVVISLLYQLEELDGELDPLRVIEKAATGSTTVTVTDTIAILRFCPKNAASLVQQIDPQEEKSVASKPIHKKKRLAGVVAVRRQQERGVGSAGWGAKFSRWACFPAPTGQWSSVEGEQAQLTGKVEPWGLVS